MRATIKISLILHKFLEETISEYDEFSINMAENLDFDSLAALLRVSIR